MRAASRANGSVRVVLLVVLALAALVVLGWWLRSGESTPRTAMPTLEKLRQTRTVTLGHRENSIPFSYFDNHQHVVGYAHEISLQIARAASEKLGVDVAIKLVPVTSQTRIPLIINNTIDLECGTTTNNRSRGRQIAFSTNYFVSGTRFLVRKDSGIKGLADLAGKNVVVGAGTTSEIALRKTNAELDLGIRIIAARDHGDAFVALEFGKAVAFMSDDAILYGEISKAKEPSRWHVVGEPLTREVYACAMRKGDPEFKAVADGEIERMMQTGEMRRLYARWFQSPIPPREVNLDVPLDPELVELFAHPNDRPLQ
ncbi:transporter substrate-binding domain-containing protein [Thermomonas sp.]